MQKTGLCDSNGTPLSVGDNVKLFNPDAEAHGEWSEYKIILRGIIPALSYLHSEKGQVLPVGMTGMPLSDFYDTEEFMRSDTLEAIRPDGFKLVRS